MFNEVNEVCEQITLMSDLFAAIVSECPEAIRKDACESMLYFSQLASEYLKQHVVHQKDRIPLESRIYAEQIVFSCLTTVACFFDKKVYDQAKLVGLEDILFMRGVITIKNILQTVPHLTTIMIDNLSYPNKRHILPSMIVYGKNKRSVN